MWLFEKRGFTSVVAYRPDKDYKKSPHREIAEASDTPTEWLLIRARVLADLVTVQELIGEDINIYTDSKADYSFRALVTRDQFKAYLARAVDDIDYDSHFKEVAEANSTQGKQRHTAMMTTWSAMAQLQPYAPYSGTVRSTSGSSSSYYPSSYTTFTNRGWKGSDYYDPEDVDEWGDDIARDLEKNQQYYNEVFAEQFGDTDWWKDSVEGDGWRDWKPSNSDSKYPAKKETSKSSKSTYAPKKVPEFIPVTFWYTPKDLAAFLSTNKCFDDLSNDQIEAMDNATFEMFLEGVDTYGGRHILSEGEISNLCYGDTTAEISEGESV